MKSSTKHIFQSILVIALILVAQSLLAQPGGGPPTGGGNPTCWPPPCIPIDGGLGFLLAAGLAFGGKKLLELRSK